MIVAVNSWQDEDRGAEVGERERQHIHPSRAQRVSDGEMRSINTRNHHALAACVGAASFPEVTPLAACKRAKNITRRTH